MEALLPQDENQDLSADSASEISRHSEREATIKSFHELQMDLKRRIREDLYANAADDPRGNLALSQNLLTPAEQLDFQEHLLN